MNGSRNTRFLVLALGCAAVAATVPLRAQQPRDTVRLREIVVTATRLPTPRDAVANGVTIITGEELRAAGVTHVLDALRDVPGAAVVRSGSFGGVTSLFLRGGESDYVRVLVDGVPVNQPGGSYNFANLSTDNVDRIEIVRGPASVLYGSDAVAGVIQVFTRQGSGAARMRVGARAGTYGSTVVEGEVVGGAGGLGYALGASRLATDGVNSLNNRYWNSTASALVRLAPDARTEAQLSARHNENEFHFPTDFAGFPSDSNQFSTGRTSTVGLDAGRRFTDRVETRFLLAWNETVDRTTNDPDSPAETDASRSRTDLRRRSADVLTNVRLGPSTIVTAGAATEEESFRNALAFDGSFGPFGDTVDVTRTNRAVYVQVLGGWADKLSVTGGMRVEDNEAFGGYATYRAGLSYRPGGGTRLRVSYGTAFKEPTFFENYGGGFSTGNPDLDPERSRSFDIGVEQALSGGRASLGATFFDQRFRDLIQYIFAVPQGSPNYRNIAGANARGLELEGRLAPFGGGGLVARYTYLHTDVADSGVDGSTFAVGKRLLRRPTHTASMTADYRLARVGVVYFTMMYVGRRDDLDFRNADPVTFQPRRVELDAYTRLDLGGEFDLVGRRGARPGLAATVRVENVFDTGYEEVLYYRAPGRAVLIGARLGVGG